MKKIKKSIRRMTMVQRSRTRLSLRLSLKQVVLASSLLIVLITLGFFLFFNLSNSTPARASITDEYRSKTSGPWSTAATWERYNGSSWVTASSAPVYTVEFITIKSGHTISVTSSTTTDQLTINSGGQLTVNNGVTLTVYNYTGTDITVDGIIKNAGTITMNSGATMVVNNGGKYQHNWTSSAGEIPTATWNTGSTCEVIGYTSNANSLAGCDQDFYDFTWNCTSQTGGVSLSGDLTTVNGDLTITSTGSGNVQLANSATSTTTVAGDYIQSGGTMTLCKTSGTTTLNIAGNYNMSGGTLQKGSGSGTVNFNGTSTQTFTKSGGTISGAVNFAILSGAVVDFGTNVIDGSTGTFNLNSGGGIITANVNGLTSSASSGTIQVAGTRTYNTGADYTYNGASAQSSGNGPTGARNFTVNNSSGLTLSNTVTVSGIVTMTSGTITTGSNELSVTNSSTTSIAGYSSTDYVIGNLRRSVNGSGSYDYPLGTSANYELLTITLSSTTGFTNILGTFVNSNPIASLLPLSAIRVSNTEITDMLDYGYWSLTPNSTITGGSYGVSLNEQGQTNTASLSTSHCVLKRSSALASWQSLGNHSNATQRISNGIVTAVRTGFTSFSHYAVGKGGGALPIELIYFKADLNDDEVDLSWATAAELNNDHFTVERSDDGIHFEELLRKPGAGNTTNTLYYADVDRKPLQGYSYYRLKQTDYDGHFTYSEIITVKYKTKGNDESELKITSIAPNPFSEKFSISFMLKTVAPVEFQLVNTSGQVVFRDVVNTTDGMNQYDFVDRLGLQTGIYFMVLIYNDKKITQKIIKN